MSTAASNENRVLNSLRAKFPPNSKLYPLRLQLTAPAGFWETAHHNCGLQSLVLAGGATRNRAARAAEGGAK